MRRGLMWRVLLVVVWCCATSRGARVLVVFPVPDTSHDTVGHSLVDVLLGAGHEVTYVTPFPKDEQNPRLRYVNISPVLGEKWDSEGTESLEHQARSSAAAPAPSPVHHTLHVGPVVARRALLHPDMRFLLQDTSVSFNLVIADWFYSGLLSPLAAVYSCPLVWHSMSDVSWLTLRLVHEASSPAYSADPLARHLPSEPNGLGHRAYRLGLQLYLTGWIYYIAYNVEEPAYHEIYSEPLKMRGRAVPEYESLVYNATLLLINSHPPLGQRLPLPQNAKYVGGHHIDIPTKPLTKNLQRVLDKARNGAVLFNMGSNFTGFPERMKMELVEMFGQLAHTVIWKFEEQLDNLPRNLYISDWVPETSVLNHPNTALLISPGDQLSMIEATHFGVPVVGIPLLGDQFLNVDLAVARGCGLRLDFSNQLPWKIKEAVINIVGNYSYRYSAKQVASVFRHRLSTPQHELMHWVQTAMAPGAGLRAPTLALSVTERWHLDLLALLLMTVWFLSKVLKLIRVYVVTPQDIDKKNR